MPDKRDVQRALANLLGDFQQKFPSRTAVLGDGRGAAASNIKVANRDGYVWARNTPTDNRFFPILNRSAVPMSIGLPVEIGYDPSNPIEEQILGIHYAGLGTISASGLPSVGTHHIQHQFRGGDETYVDSRLFLPGLVRPTNPVSMSVYVEPFTYFYNGWKRYAGGTTDSLTQYKPGTDFNAILVLVAFDPSSTSILLRPGLPFAVTFLTDTVDISQAPSSAGDELPLGLIYLRDSTTAIDWVANADNVMDARQHVMPTLINVTDRIRQLEGYTGNDPNIATTGAAGSSVDDRNISVYRVEALASDREYSASATTLGEIANVLGTLITDLRDRNVIG